MIWSSDFDYVDRPYHGYHKVKLKRHSTYIGSRQWFESRKATIHQKKMKMMNDNFAVNP